jgi:septum site-determining protein MinD
MKRSFVRFAGTVSSKKSTSSRVVTVTSGKGGVGKTTTAASFAYGLAEKGYKTCVIDFDIGLRNLDIHLGCERRVIFDFVNVLLKGNVIKIKI